MPLALHLAPYAAIASRVAEMLAASRKAGAPFEPWTNEVVVASSGVSTAITAALLDRLPGGFAGLNLQTIETLAARIVSGAGEHPRVATDAERRLAMRVAARSIDDPMVETRGAAAMLERTYRDVRDSGLTLEDLGKRVGRAPSLRHRVRIRTILRAFHDYERLLARLGCIDPADLLARAAAIVKSGGTVAPQILAGFYDMTGAQKALISTLRDVEKLDALFIPLDPERPAPFAQPFISTFATNAALGTQHPALRVKVPRWDVSEARTREAEIEGVCARIAEMLAQGSSPTSIGIVARALDAYDVHLFNRFAAQHGFAVSSGESMPLHAHRIGRGISLLLRLRDREFLRGDVVEIVRCGLKVKTRINIDKADLETRQAQIAGGSSAELQGRAARSLAIGDYVALVAELEDLTAKIDARFLRRIADLFRVETESDVAALDAIDRIADLTVRATIWSKPFDPSDVLDAIANESLTSSSAPAPTVWLGDVMRFRGRSFEHVFAIRMQEEVVPQRRNDDPLLPDADRRELGVREIGNGRDEEQLLFQLLCDGAAGALHFSYASSDGFGKPLRASQFLKSFIIERQPESKQAVLKNFSRFVGGTPPPRRPKGAAEGGGAPLRPLQLFARAGTNGPFDGYITSERVLLRAAASLQAVSPTQLEDFGECPQKFLLKHILKVRDIDDPQRDVQINHRDKGIVDHRILERFYRTMTRDEIDAAARALPLLPETLRDRLEAFVDTEFDAFEERIPPYNRQMRAIERRATKRVLGDFVVSDLADLIERGLTPAHFEYRFGAKHKEHVPDHADPFIVEARGVPLRVEGTIDRIDAGSGTFRIVDYKSGKALRHGKLADKIDRGVRLQLAVYAMAVAEFFGADPSTISATIKPLVRDDSDPDTFAFHLGDKREGLLKTLDVFVAAILRGAFPAFPNESDKDFNSCKYCPVMHSCRTRHDAGESRTVLRAGEARTLLEQGS